MDAKRILKFLRQLAKNNNRTWFQEHKQEYDAVRADFERGIEQAIRRIVTFDPSVIHLTVKYCTYRFYRDTRFSNDKSPYKNHLGAYIAAHGKKALHGGYYIHLEPGHSFPTPTDVSSWDQPQGFGLERLKTCPSGFPRDWKYVDYLRQKDYCCWHQVPDDFYQGDVWLDAIEPMFRAAKPMMDMMNNVIDDYE